MAKTGATDTSWYPDWSKEQCVIVASGPSARTVNLERAKGKAKFIAVNRSWELCPWADVLYGCDFSWWESVNFVPDFQGMRVSQHAACQRRNPDGSRKYPLIYPVHCPRSYENGGKMQDMRGSVGWGGNSGFQALNLAIQFGTKKIILVGFDMRLDRGLHWHGSHGKYRNKTLRNPHGPQVQRWRKAMDAAKPFIDAAGVKVINSSMVSNLTAYPKIKFEDAIVS